MSSVPARVWPICEEGSWSSGVSLISFCSRNTWSDSKRGRDVVLEPMDVRTTGQDRCLLEGLLPDSGKKLQTGRIYVCFIVEFLTHWGLMSRLCCFQKTRWESFCRNGVCKPIGLPTHSVRFSCIESWQTTMDAVYRRNINTVNDYEAWLRLFSIIEMQSSESVLI